MNYLEPEILNRSLKLSGLKSRWLLITGIIATLITFLLIYSHACSNWITGDDFIYLSWADKALHSPELILEKYWKSAANSLIFYRPFIYTVLLVEYKLWGLKSVYFHLVNLITEILSGLMLGLILTSLSTKSIEGSFLSNKQLKIWALLSAALFVLHPLHNEPVNSISDQVDLLVTFFSLFSFWCYIKWRTEHKQLFFSLSISVAVLAFLTKEMAVALPPTIFFYELFFSKDRYVETSIVTSKFVNMSKLRNALVATLPYWLILVLYFGIRTIILGDPIAGYADNICQQNVHTWLLGLSKIFIPIDPLIISTHSYIFKLWCILLGITVTLSLIATSKTEPKNRKIIYFLVIWFLLAILPTCKIFSFMMNYLSGSRIAYLATVPLCGLLTYGLAVFSVNNRYSSIVRLLTLLLLALASTVLYKYNNAWKEAGIWTNTVFQKISNCYLYQEGDPPIYITGLPVYHKTGIFCIGLLESITKTPFMNKDFFRCVRLDNNELCASPGILKDTVVNKQKKIQLLYWDKGLDTLTPVPHPLQSSLFIKKWRGHNLQRAVTISSVPNSSTPKINWLSDGTLEIVAPEKNMSIALDIDVKGLPCWCVDLLALKARFSDPKSLGSPAQVQLLFTNDYLKQSDASINCYAPIKTSEEEQEIIFPLRNIPAWTMGGNCSSIRIVLPIVHTIRISELAIAETNSLIPQVNLQTLAYDPPGQIRLDQRDHKSQSLQFDAKGIRACKYVVLDIIPSSQSFESIDFQKTRKGLILQRKAANTYGQLTIHRKDLPLATGVFRGRIRAFDDTKNQIGLPSDTFLIFVDS